MVAEWIEPLLVFDLGSEARLYALFFLLGSFAVATVSDVKHLAAQREFLEVWAVFAFAVLALDLAQAGFEVEPWFVVKWLLVAGFSLASWEKTGPWLRLAIGDVAACAAAASLLPAGLVLGFYVILKLVSVPAAGILARGRSHYPFMPVVTVATVALLAWGMWLAPFVL